MSFLFHFFGNHFINNYFNVIKYLVNVLIQKNYAEISIEDNVKSIVHDDLLLVVQSIMFLGQVSVCNYCYKI